MRNLLTKYNWKLPLVCLLLFLSLIGGMCFYYVNDVRDAASKPQITLGNTVGPENVGELAQGRSVSQTFQYALDELDGIRLYFVNFNRENEGCTSSSRRSSRTCPSWRRAFPRASCAFTANISPLDKRKRWRIRSAHPG